MHLATDGIAVAATWLAALVVMTPSCKIARAAHQLPEQIHAHLHLVARS
jgi:hypothetical protein